MINGNMIYIRVMMTDPNLIVKIMKAKHLVEVVVVSG
jgi:hypothetical protein